MKRTEADVRETFKRGVHTKTASSRAIGVECEIHFWPDAGLAERVQATLQYRRKLKLQGLAMCLKCGQRLRAKEGK